MKKAIVNTVLFLANLIGIYFYIKYASLAWALPEEKGLDPAMAGVAMVWGLSALPIAIVFLLIDGSWWYITVSRKLRMGVVVSASMLWVVAIAVDFYHH